MTKQKPMHELTAAEITARLAEIDAEQHAFEARDFDAELGEAMRQGSDVDSLEDQHLQAERVARRLRVERQALESALPEAKRREGAADLAAVEADFDALTERAAQAKAQILAKWQAMEASLSLWAEVQEEAETLSRRAMIIGEEGGITSLPKKIGMFRSSELGNVRSGIGDAAYGFRTDAQSSRGIFGTGGVALD